MQNFFLLLCQVHILITIATGEPNYYVDLVTIRLASLNQTLDPWLYILLRKSFITKLIRTTKRMFCVPRFKTSDREDIYDRNIHAHHLRCYRRNCHMPAPHFHLQGHITPSGRCVVQFKRRSKSKSKTSEENKQRLSLPDVMKDAHTKTPSARPDIAGHYDNGEVCVQCQSFHRTKSYNKSFKTPVPRPEEAEKVAYENEAMISKVDTTSEDESETSTFDSKQCDMCTGAVEPTKGIEPTSDDDDDESDDDSNVFLDQNYRLVYGQFRVASACG